MASEPGALRPRFEAVLRRAAETGFEAPERLWRMTPGEAALALKAHAARLRLRREEDERLAWMTGYYCAVAFHSPRRYPRRSGTAFSPVGCAAADEAQMKALLKAMAARRNDYDAGYAED